MSSNLATSFTNYESGLGASFTDICPGSKFLVFMSILNTLVMNNEKISRLHERVKPVETPDLEYDFVVIGGGAGGSPVAARLSENPNWKVLLLEAGGDEPPGAEVPAFTFKFLASKGVWNYKTTNESHACLSTDGSCNWVSGKNLGGNTAHHAMIYLRGLPKDFDDWADAGNEGWTWNEVEPFFIKGEDNGEIERVGRKHHGTGGPQSVERFPYQPPMSHSILNASIEAGYGVSEDLNGDVKTGFSIIQTTTKKGVRYSSAASYLWVNRNRENLHISLNSFVSRIIIEDDKAVGVEYYKNGEKKQVRVTREVICAGGTVGSPRILLLSGIGPKEHLESKGVEVVRDLPGVGQNLHDHVTVPMYFTINAPDTYLNDWAAAAEYNKSQTGPLSCNGLPQVNGVLASDKTSPDYPDLQFYFNDFGPGCAPGPVGAIKSTNKLKIEVGPSILRPKSRGRITLASNDPFELPNIWANYLSDPEDVDLMVTAFKMGLKLSETEALSSYNFTLVPVEACSNYEFRSDEYWRCTVKQNVVVVYHWAGTCKMGPSTDLMAVVDNRLRVHGIKNLRVADTSIQPVVVSANTQASTMMIGERAAQFIKEDWGYEA